MIDFKNENDAPTDTHKKQRIDKYMNNNYYLIIFF